MGTAPAHGVLRSLAKIVKNLEEITPTNIAFCRKWTDTKAKGKSTARKPHPQTERFTMSAQFNVTVTRITPTAAIAAAVPATERMEQAPACHSKDWATVNWFGVTYTFSPRQRPVIAALWTAWQEGNPFLSQETLLELAESDSMRVRDVFKNHPAWGKLIQHGPMCGGSLGTYRFVEPHRA